jgi:HSP20 family protein
MTFGTLVHRPVLRRAAIPSFDRLMTDLYRDLGTSPSALLRPACVVPTPPQFAPLFSVEESEIEYRVVAEIPGVEAADLEINVEDGVLTIRGERHYARSAEREKADATAEADPVKAARRNSVKFERKLRFAGDVVETGVTAHLRNGVLTVTVPKPEERKPEVRTIPIETV